ncbi:MAG: IS1595 family transposase [Gillisia sp.]
MEKINGSVRDVGKNLTYLPEAGLKEPGFIVPIQVNLAEIYEILHWFELGLTDNDIAERLELDYRRLHRLLLKVRKAIAAYENRTIQVLEKVVEVDESYFGAQFKNRRRKQREKLRKEGKVKRGRGAKKLKQPVFGIYERTDGLVYTELVEDVSKSTLQDILKGKVSIETTIYSDTWKSYRKLDKIFKGHETIDHGKKEYAKGEVTINGIEGFWGYAQEGLLKHHGMSTENFPYYLKEMEFRWNNRRLNQKEFVKLIFQVLANKNGAQIGC